MVENIRQPIYKRQRFLLAFIRQLKDGVTSTDLQKLVFLYIEEKEKSRLYDFIPYKFGAYSFQLAEDVNILRRNGYLVTEGSRIRAIGDYQYKELFSIANERGDKLIRRTYREYPYFAINSEIAERLFSAEEAEQFKRRKQFNVQTSRTLFTIGYEGRSIEAFMNTFIQNNIRVLCDVRKNPISHKFGFSKGKLAHIAEALGIKYVHMPDLGIESCKRRSLNTIEDYQCLFEEYVKAIQTLKPQLEYLYSLLYSSERIALMCYERIPEMCHRHVIRDYLSETYKIRSVDL